MASATGDPHFDIDPNIVFQLGDELITDVVTALVELVKNSYDADASYARVVVNSEGTNPDPDTRYSDAKGYILIEDDGDGMDERTIRNGWLLISASPKRAMKAAGKTTDRGRTPLGDKGVGRLGTQRLGNHVEILTRKEGASKALHISFSWDDFRHVRALSDVKAEITRVDPTFKKGTRLTISGLSDARTWTDQEALRGLQSDLSKLISPYKEIQEFTASINVNGNPVDLAEVGAKVQRAASLHYAFKYNGEELQVLGRAKMSLFRSQNLDDIEYHDILESDRGEQFLAFLRGLKETERFSVRRSQASDWFLEARQTIRLDDMPKLVRLASKEGQKPVIANPGTFNGRIDAFDLSPRSLRDQDVFNASKQFRDYVSTLSGVRVYRDGFGVKVDEDWLGLGEAWTSGGSYYGLKPTTTMGFVAISARDNAGLVETTDREAFKATPEYENFYAILQEVVKFTSEVQEALRRGFVEYRKTRQRQAAGVGPEETAEQLTKRVAERLSRAKEHRVAIRDIGKALSTAAERTSQTFDELTQRVDIRPAELKAIHRLRNDARTAIAQALDLIKQLDEHIKDLSELKDQGQVLHNEMLALRTRLNEMYEMVGLGLTAEALSHEIHQIAERLAARVRDLLRHLGRSRQPDVKVVSFAENVKSAIAALRKQLSHLAPSLRYVREQREQIAMVPFVEQLVDFYADRFRGSKVEIAGRTGPAGGFDVHINRGKLTQIFDNLVLNSQYWLQEDIAAERIDRGLITIEVDAPYVRIYDNGTGVHPTVEESLFEPFVTRKPRGVGRGLGLFIVRQLLDSEGSYISLLPTRNVSRRRYIFQFDFSGSRSDGE